MKLIEHAIEWVVQRFCFHVTVHAIHGSRRYLTCLKCGWDSPGWDCSRQEVKH
jgi:hypothetical protein